MEIEFFANQGANLSHIIIVKDLTTNAAINIASWTFASQLKKSYYNANVTANLTCTKVDSANGNLIVSLSATQLQAIAPGKYLYDCLGRDANNVIRRLEEGVIIVTPGVTTWL